MVYKSGQIFLPFCHNPRVWQTVCIPCSAVKRIYTETWILWRGQFMITLIGGCVSAKCSYISTSSTVYLKHMTSCSPKFIQVIARFLLKRIRIWRFEELDFFLSHFPNHVQKSPHFCFQFHQPLATVVFSTINWRFGNIFKHFND